MDTRNIFSGLLKDVKAIVKENTNNKSDLIIGTVISTGPLQVKINVSEGSLILDKEFLTLSTLVLDFEVDVDIEFKNNTRTEIGYGPEPHDHEVRGEKSKQKLKVYLGLKEGEKVLLIRVAQGQHYLVIDRVRDNN